MHRRDFCSLTAATLAAIPLPACRRNPVMIQKPIRPTGHSYSQAYEISSFQRLLFISGQVPEAPDGTVPADYRSQYRLAWANVEAQLSAAGMSFDNLVKVTIFLSDRRYVAESYGLRQEIIGDRSPALTIVIAGIYDEAWLLEIEAIAAA
jgi:2-iminobutanoate/2-iminopropanoate deaminase